MGGFGGGASTGGGGGSGPAGRKSSGSYNISKVPGSYHRSLE